MQAQVDQLMSRYDGNVPGASLLVIRDGKPLVRRSYGLANVEDRTVATPATNYRLASVTKQFTAASILLLAEERKLNLDDSLRKWLPGLPDVANAMTIRHVLSHMSGLVDYEDFIPSTMTEQLHDSDVLKILETQNRTYFPPGTNYRYSNSGYALLALIVAKASGKDFATFLNERIFAPLGMTNTVAYEQRVSSVANRAYGYSEADSSSSASTRAPSPEPRALNWLRTDQSQTSAVLGDGGIYSSIDDLAKWDAALYDNRLLSTSSRELAFTPVTDTDDPKVRYAMGWRVTHEQIGGRTVWHSGETIGFRNVIIRYPERHFTVILLTNRNDPEPYQTARAIAALFLR
jgi:CubicO group peptidase (beta-lactamase class C family)